MENKFINTKQLAEILGVHTETIYNWAKEGLPRIKISERVIRYDLDEVMEWVKERNEKSE